MSGFESRESVFQIRGAAVLNDCLANGVRRNGTRASGTDDDRVLLGGGSLTKSNPSSCGHFKQYHTVSTVSATSQKSTIPRFINHVMKHLSTLCDRTHYKIAHNALVNCTTLINQYEDIIIQ